MAHAGARGEGAVHRVVDEVRGDPALPALPEVPVEERVVLGPVVDPPRARVEGVGEVRGVRLGELDHLVRVVQEGPRPLPHQEAGHQARPGALLRVAGDVGVAVVGDLALEEIHPGGDRAVEEVGLADRQRVVLRALAALRVDLEGLAGAEEVRGREGGVDEGALEAAHAAAEGELVAVLLLDLEGDVDLVVRGLARADVGRALHRLEVAELVDPLDRHLEGLGVEHVALVHVDLAADDLVPRRVVAGEADPPEEVLLVLLHLHGDVHDLLLGVGLPLRAARPLEVAEAAVDVAQLLVGLLELRVVVDVARHHLEVAPDEVLLEDGEPLELQLPHPVLLALGHRDLEAHELDSASS